MNMQNDFIEKLKLSGLIGRSGASFPTGAKWEIVKNSQANKKYIVCNGSEGEPGVFKDKYILEKHPDKVVDGIKIALETIDNSTAYIYLNEGYYKKFKNKLQKLCDGYPIIIFEDHYGYLGGEETALCEVIEGKKPIVRKKPPFPCESGLWGCPTLVNNVETFYYVAKVAEDKFENKRFYSISGDVKKEGTWEFAYDSNIRNILEETGNYPDFDFFVQVGGGGCGEIMLPTELDQPVNGAGSIIVFNKEKTDLYGLMKKWAEFFMIENCDKCVPCREGVYRLNEMLKEEKIDKELLEDLFFVLDNTSFCALGRGAAIPFRSLINKVL